MTQKQAYDVRSAPFNGPFDIVSKMIDAATAPNVEGLWTDAGFAQSNSIEVAGSFSTVGVDVYGSNEADAPPNQYVVTLGSSATADDVVTLHFFNQNAPAGSRDVAYTVQSGDDINAVAAGLAAAINADSVLLGLGVSAAAASAVVTISYPSRGPASNTSVSQPPASNATVLTRTLSVGATETAAIAAGANGTKIGSTIAAAGITDIAAHPRWITSRLVTLTGASAVASSNYHGVA